MRAPTVADMLRMDKLKGSDAEKELHIIADLCEVAPRDLEALVIADYVKLQKKFAAFFRSES